MMDPTRGTVGAVSTTAGTTKPATTPMVAGFHFEQEVHMKLVINTTDGGNLSIEDFDTASLMQMFDDWDKVNVLAFALDTGMAYIPKAAITRIDALD